MGQFWVPADPREVQVDQYTKWYTTSIMKKKMGQTKALRIIKKKKNQSVIILIKPWKDFIIILERTLFGNSG